MNDHWNTPWWVLEPIYDYAGYFSLDPCSNARSIVPADVVYTKRDNGLLQPWFGNVFINPPYSFPNLHRWSQKCAMEYGAGHTDEQFLLVPAYTSAAWWQQNVCRFAHAVLFYDRRINFKGFRGSSPTFHSALVYYGDRPEAFCAAMSHLGWTTRVDGYKRPRYAGLSSALPAHSCLQPQTELGCRSSILLS